MRIFNYHITIKRLDADKKMRQEFLNKAEKNAKLGLIQAELELKHHTLLLEHAPALNRTEAEIKGYKEAIERDVKTISNWKNQLQAIDYERN